MRYQAADHARAGGGAFAFSLGDMPFGRRLSHLSVCEADLPDESGSTVHQLYIAKLTKRCYASKLPDEPSFPGLIMLRPYKDGASVDFKAAGTPGLLTADMDGGSVEMCFGGQNVLRIRGKGPGLRLYAPLKEHEAAIDRLDGTYQVSLFDGVGEFLIVPLKGHASLYSVWDWKKAGTTDLLFDIMPDADGEYELCVHYAAVNTRRGDAYQPFDACAAEAAADFEAWYAMYPGMDARYERTKQISAYNVWINYVGPLGRIKGNVLMYDKQTNAFCWHSAFNAMPMLNSADGAVDMLLTIFDYQDEYGQLPDLVDDRYVNYLSTKPPYQGAALLYLMDRLGGRLTDEHCRRLYGPLCRLHGWWLTMRDTDGDGVPQYNQGCESGHDSTTALSRGVPVECPDIISYIILLEEALGRLAERLQKPMEAEAWHKRSEALLHTLTTSFWDGRRFAARVSTTHEIVDIPGIEAYSPIMLGHRLPREILDEICERIDKDYMTDSGITEFPHGGPGAPSFDYVLGFNQIRTAVGLADAGKKELAIKLMRGFCDENAQKLPRMGYVRGNKPAEPGIRTELFYENYGKCSSLACGIFLTLGGLLYELQNEAHGKEAAR